MPCPGHTRDHNRIKCTARQSWNEKVIKNATLTIARKFVRSPLPSSYSLHPRTHTHGWQKLCGMNEIETWVGIGKRAHVAALVTRDKQLSTRARRALHSPSRTRAEIAIVQGNALRIYGSKSDCHQNKKKIDIAARLSLLILLLFALSNWLPFVYALMLSISHSHSFYLPLLSLSLSAYSLEALGCESEN